MAVMLLPVTTVENACNAATAAAAADGGGRDGGGGGGERLSLLPCDSLQSVTKRSFAINAVHRLAGDSRLHQSHCTAMLLR